MRRKPTVPATRAGSPTGEKDNATGAGQTLAVTLAPGATTEDAVVSAIGVIASFRVTVT
ncbi:MAG TPA: hypothetical protein VFY98_12765 [Intrasporangium sp.]|nr:hypothetical protein [Intrasporangium sp.]